MEILINKGTFQNDKFVEVYICEDTENRTGYDVYTTYTYNAVIPDFNNSPYVDYFELIARKVATKETAEHIAKVFAYDNGLVYGGNRY